MQGVQQRGKVRNSIVRSEESKMVGNRSSRSKKRQEKQRSIIKPTAFADSKASGQPGLTQQGLPEHSFHVIASFQIDLLSSFLLLNMSLQVLFQLSSPEKQTKFFTDEGSCEETGSQIWNIKVPLIVFLVQVFIHFLVPVYYKFFLLLKIY